MNRATLSVMMAAAAGISKAAAERALNAGLEAMDEELRRGGKVTLSGFGTFSIANRKPRVGRDARSGTPIFIPPQRTVKFVPSKQLKANVNGWNL
jgi:DNA-binding protein HU-beta